METKTPPSQRTLGGLDWLNFLLADAQTGVGPFLAIYLAGYKWKEETRRERFLNSTQGAPTL